VRILVLNAGSSSLKASVLDLASDLAARPTVAASTAVALGSDASRGADEPAAVARAIDAVESAGVAPSSIEAVAHRVVHGGTSFAGPVVVDDAVLERIEALTPFAPLHNPVAVATIRAAAGALPGRPQVAAFDTAFHATLPEVARRYPVPARWTADWGIRRFGFHGLSVEWSVERAAEMLGRPAAVLALLVAHLGNGCSVSAVLAGRSMATSMGMTPLEGLMMGTRAGSIDPGVPLRLLGDGRLTLAELAEDLDHRSGLLGVSGVSGDLRQVQEAADKGDRDAVLALAMFVDRAAAGIAGAATALPRLDAIVFTGGIGEHAGRVRAAIVDRLGVLGIRPIEPEETGSDRVLATVGGGPSHAAGPSGGAPVLRIAAREDVVMARAAARLLAPTSG
jgi:acetate kinase